MIFYAWDHMHFWLLNIWKEVKNLIAIKTKEKDGVKRKIEKDKWLEGKQ